MLLTRRELTMLRPAMAAAAQTPAGTDVGGSQTISYEDLTRRISMSTKR